ncbi:sulfatase-like hydrolase/transferase [Vibrio sp. WXL103]|uniref:sulfatase-like hydrolase/transferase n=1 Tax=unclassified Vibrio TaxID=2614977 RepID=UPI003EC8D418
MNKKIIASTIQLMVVLPTLYGCSQGAVSNSAQVPAKAPVQATAQTFDAQSAPNVLWIITDDHRPDSISGYNKAMFGTKESPLGYVESPNTDKLIEEGTLFTTAFSNSPMCGPSRGSLLSGRYPFRNGHYAFELTHTNPDFVRPTVPESVRDVGYQTAVFGKEDAYIYAWGPGQGFHDAGFFDYKVHFKHDLQKNGKGDLFTTVHWGHDENGKLQNMGSAEKVIYPDGSEKTYVIRRKNGELTAEEIAAKDAVTEEFDILRAYTRFNQNLILGGVNPMPQDETVDAYIVKELQNYLENADKRFKTSWGKTARGADSSKPQYIQLGFHLPHTPVLPPKEVRERFQDKVYNIPDYDRSETELLPRSLQQVQRAGDIYPMTYEEKQQAIQDYYAFAAHGDYLVGKAVESFKKYSEDNGQEWLIIYTIGDHGWHLGEQGTMAKFGPWKQSVANAAIVTSSDKSLIPAGAVYKDMVEFVDFAPTVLTAAGIDVNQPQFDYLDGYNLFDVYNEKLPKREYALGEINAIGSPRGYLHTDRFRFSMRTRPFNNWVREDQLGKDIKWALEATPEEAEMVLYDLEYDPLEQKNVAYDADYAELADWFRNKLGNIVLGDRRAEADWSKANSYYISDFALGADDKVADIPADLIPTL